MGHIIARDVVLDFPVYNSLNRSFKNTVLRATTGGQIARDSRTHVHVRSLDHLSFEFREGERIGLVGHNGSGKTTLLRMLSGVYAPTAGDLRVKGRVASLLDISLGLDPDATGHENIMMRGIMMGMTPRQVAAKTDEIAEFTDLGEYLAMPLRTYSSGMQVRLAFAVSTCVEAEILLMDEWLSVGDSSFQERATQRLKQLVDRTPVLVLASHAPELVESVCTRAIELSHGRIKSERTIAVAT